jgi:hypothetical protein
MAYCTVNGAPVLEGVVRLPRVGVWQADLEMPAGVSLSGRATIKLADALTLVGTFARSGLDRRGRARARVVGGAAGLGRELAPKSYLNVPLRIPLTDVLTDAGEHLSATADPTVLALQLPAWSRMSQVAGLSFAALVDAAGATWRILLDGTAWVGIETWPTSNMTALAMSYEPERFRRTVATLIPTVLPGQVFEGERVALVQHVIAPSSFRTVLEIDNG